MNMITNNSQKKYSEKIEIMRNKILNEKYPWIYSKKNPDEIDFSSTPLDWLPTGWKISFGEILPDEIDQVIKEENLTDFKIEEMKEKWGGLDIYVSFKDEDGEISFTTDKLQELFEAFRAVSKNVCSSCGKIFVPTINCGYVIPLCRECYEEGTNSSVEYKDTCGFYDYKVTDILNRIIYKQ